MIKVVPQRCGAAKQPLGLPGVPEGAGGDGGTPAAGGSRICAPCRQRPHVHALCIGMRGQNATDL